ncbi:type III-B CRISPR module-associated protein Cmr5 [Neolewinella agarilytica]|uniref:CRISPR-associated protein (Cas_Cmr5) n=1 Tax=Neolewinella agarilytica TaxID=478744 RepID=A0A1H9HC60_9BACT|nr:type III-B CRISPR module-associated protein Cmr5 [Neolewinella agarilytica]SEQ59940.1 CRISPR-associated protein (Cas_Cmr5) [Neolewinella agarilytica]
MYTLNKDYLRVALAKLDASGLVKAGGRVDKAIPNYVAALSPSLRATGLIATLAIYASDDAGKGAAAKLPVLNLITSMLSDDELQLLPETERKSLASASNMFYWAIKQDKKQFPRIQRQLETATAAIKVAIRTYKIPKA